MRSPAEQVRRLEKKVERGKVVLLVLPEISLQIVEFARERGRIPLVTPSSWRTQPQYAETAFRKLVEEVKRRADLFKLRLSDLNRAGDTDHAGQNRSCSRSSDPREEVPILEWRHYMISSN